MRTSPSAPARPIGSLQGLGFLDLTANTWAVFAPDRSYLLKEIRFCANSASTALVETGLVQMQLAGQDLFGGSAVPFPLLCANEGTTVWASGTTTVIIWEAPQLIPISKGSPFKVRSSVAAKCLIVAIDMETAA